MSNLLITSTPLPGLYLVKRNQIADERGYLSRLFCAAELDSFGWMKPIAQINQTQTRQCGTVRGLHYQRPPYAEAKLVSCLRGVVWDLAVDLRPASPTYLKWYAQQLSPENGQALLIPQGFAHGFQALSDDVEMLYCHSAPYNQAAEAGLNPVDPRLAITWPLPVRGLSARDAAQAHIQSNFEGVSL